jgi:hypothetical protein
VRKEKTDTEFWERTLRTKDIWEADNCRALGWKDRTGSGSCPLAVGFGNDRPEPPDSATRILVNKTDLQEMVCESGRWIELAQDRVRWRAALVMTVLSIRILPPEY